MYEDIVLSSIRHHSPAGKRVLLRVDFNMPIRDGRLLDETRLLASLETIEHLRLQDSTVILVSHLGSPTTDRASPDLSLEPVARRLEELLVTPVTMAPDCVGPDVEAIVSKTRPGDVVLLENTRFHEGEMSNDPRFAADLASLGDIFVNDAFATIHRAHASTVGVAALLPSFAGLLLEREFSALSRLLQQPEHPYVVAIGGARAGEKLDALENLIGVADSILIGGTMAVTFFASTGGKVGSSHVDDEQTRRAARTLLDRAYDAGCEMLLPVDFVVAPDGRGAGKATTVAADAIPDGMCAVDIGPRTRMLYSHRIKRARTMFWNGPMGVFETPEFAKGTHAIAASVAVCPGRTVVGGAHSAVAITDFGLAHRVDHVSTGGRASLLFLAGKPFPGLEAIRDTHRSSHVVEPPAVSGD